MRLGYLHRQHRGREVGARRHPVPDLVQVVSQILLELVQRHSVHARRTLIGLHLLVGLPHLLLRDSKRLSQRFQLAHAAPPGRARLTERTTATDDPTPSLHRHYSGFTTTTSRSASTPRDGTHSLTGTARLETPCRRPRHPRPGTAVSGHAFPRSTRKQQTKLTSPICRTPPGQ